MCTGNEVLSDCCVIFRPSVCNINPSVHRAVEMCTGNEVLSDLQLLCYFQTKRV